MPITSGIRLPVPEISAGSVRQCQVNPRGTRVQLFPTWPKLRCFPYARAILPAVREPHVMYPARKFWKFCNTSILVPGASGSDVTPTYPYPKFTNNLTKHWLRPSRKRLRCLRFNAVFYVAITVLAAPLTVRWKPGTLSGNLGQTPFRFNSAALHQIESVPSLTLRRLFLPSFSSILVFCR